MQVRITLAPVHLPSVVSHSVTCVTADHLRADDAIGTALQHPVPQLAGMRCSTERTAVRRELGDGGKRHEIFIPGIFCSGKFRGKFHSA
jgi:hypothetical protein